MLTTHITEDKLQFKLKINFRRCYMKFLKQILQGLNGEEHIVNAFEYLKSHELNEELIISSAYLRSTGVRRLNDTLQLDSYKIKKAYIGINNQSTSIQGIKSLEESGFDVLMVNTERRDAIFHLKAYLAIGQKKAVLVSGSANLTSQGLTKNLEHVVVLEFDMTDRNDKQEIEKLKESLSSLEETYPNNILLSNTQDLNNYLIDGWLENEMDFKHSAETRGLNSSGDNKSPNKMKLPKPPKFIKAELQVDEEGEIKQEQTGIHSKLGTGELVWRKNKLSNADAQITKGNAKGYMTLGNKTFRRKADGTQIDNKTYMRYEVFAKLNWSQNEDIDVREDAYANFEFWFDGAFVEKQKLLISHNESREPAQHGGQDQHQPLTSLHVCGFSSKFKEVVGKNLAMYRIDDQNYRIEVE